MDRTAGERKLAMNASNNAWDEGRKRTMEQQEDGSRARRPTLENGVRGLIDPPSRKVNKALKESFAEEMSPSFVVHRDKSTGRCGLSVEERAPTGSNAVGLAQPLPDWIKLVLQSDDGRGLLVHRLSTFVSVGSASDINISVCYLSVSSAPTHTT
jgi:hypothetical protein